MAKMYRNFQKIDLLEFLKFFHQFWEPHAVGRFDQYIVPVADDLFHGGQEISLGLKPVCLGLRIGGRSFCQAFCQVSDGTDYVDAMLPRMATLRPIAISSTSIAALVEMGLAL